MGYCEQPEKMILVYEYLPKGNLQEILSGKAQISLAWNQRLQIALDAAQGLEYLHSVCKPAIIHRDIKSSNILLNDSLEAKLADFGMSKSDMPEDVNFVSTDILGTAGYLDPEYCWTSMLNEKSDVYSFGVVLLELISAAPPFVPEPSGTRIHITEWARQHLVNGRHGNVADPKLEGKYNVSSLWRVANMALRCTALKRMERPSMDLIVTELNEAIALCKAASDDDTSESDSRQASLPALVIL